MAHSLTQTDDDYIPPDLIELTHQPVTVRQYERLCRKHRKLRLELSSSGELIILPPKGLASGARNADLIYQLVGWAQKDRSGVSFGSTIFTLSNRARRIPDAAWVKHETYDRLTRRQKEGFGPLCPDFVVEVMSPPDSLAQLCDKMLEYTENGVSLGWLIDPYERRVYVYRADQELQILEKPETVSGDPPLPGFKLITAELWGPDLQDLQD